MNRRSFFKGLCGAIAVASTGITLPALALELGKRKINARHLWEYDIVWQRFNHRIDVKTDTEQWGVDLATQSEVLDPERELAPALSLLNDVLEREDLQLGEIHSYTWQQWNYNTAAQQKWGKLG